MGPGAIRELYSAPQSSRLWPWRQCRHASSSCPFGCSSTGDAICLVAVRLRSLFPDDLNQLSFRWRQKSIRDAITRSSTLSSKNDGRDVVQSVSTDPRVKGSTVGCSFDWLIMCYLRSTSTEKMSESHSERYVRKISHLQSVHYITISIFMGTLAELLGWYK